ncbi:MAG: thermonuclease family protein [Phycisphaerae bacterium]
MSRRPAIPDSVVLPSRWRRVRCIVLIVGVAVAAVVVDRALRPPPAVDDQSRYHDRDFRVVRVVDGDTLDIDIADRDKPWTRIRFWGVDAPEVAKRGRAGAYFGEEARAFAERTVAGRTVHVVLSPRKTRGKYGRLLAYVFLERGGVMLNELLLERGFAYADRRFAHHYMDEFRAIEGRARREGVGLWKDVTLDDMPAWRRRFEGSDEE